MTPEQRRLRAAQRLLKGWWRYFITLGVIGGIIGGYWLFSAALYLRISVWPAQAIAACDGDALCVVGVSFTDAYPLWLGLLWIALIAMIFVAAARVERPKGSSATVTKRLLRQRNDERQQRLGRVVGSILVVSSLTFVTVLTLVPAVEKLITALSWPQDRVQACGEIPTCLISSLSANAMPVWIAFIWVAIIAAAMVLCWHPSRWWDSDSAGNRRIKVYNFTSPSWIGMHATVAVLVCFRVTFGIAVRDTYVPALEYWWPCLAALTIRAIIAYHDRTLTKRANLGLVRALGVVVSSWFRVFNPRWHLRRQGPQRSSAVRAEQEQVNASVSAAVSNQERSEW